MESSVPSLDAIKEALPDFAKDTRINLSSVLTPAGSPGLEDNQIAGIALACAYASGNASAATSLAAALAPRLTDAEKTAAASAATIMAMNNVYYRFLHVIEDADYRSMPAGLRMTVIGNPGIAKTDFELYSLAVSAINGCASCINAHAAKVVASGLPKTAVQSAIRIAAVVRALAQATAIADPPKTKS